MFNCKKQMCTQSNQAKEAGSLRKKQKYMINKINMGRRRSMNATHINNQIYSDVMKIFF
jgi:hypothetical protein